MDDTDTSDAEEIEVISDSSDCDEEEGMIRSSPQPSGSPVLGIRPPQHSFSQRMGVLTPSQRIRSAILASSQAAVIMQGHQTTGDQQHSMAEQPESPTQRRRQQQGAAPAVHTARSGQSVSESQPDSSGRQESGEALQAGLIAQSQPANVVSASLTRPVDAALHGVNAAETETGAESPSRPADHPPENMELSAEELDDNPSRNVAVVIENESQRQQEVPDNPSAAAAAIVEYPGGTATVATSADRRDLSTSAVWMDTDFRDTGPVDSRSSQAATVDDAALPAMESAIRTTPKKANTGNEGPAKAECDSPGSDGDQNCCPICFEAWSNSGQHRIASLRCGHLFGKSCIERWLRGRDQRCPQCNDKAHRRDVRVLFAKSLRVLDTTDRDRAIEQLEREREAKRRLELDLSVVKVKCEMKQTLIERLQAELAQLRRTVGGPAAASCAAAAADELAAAAAAAGPPTPAAVAPSCVATLEMCRAGGCRVMEYNGWLGMLVVSQPTSQPHSGLFPMHGVRKVSTVDMQPLQFISLHNKQVRDVRFSPEQRDLLLTCSLDKTAKITNMSCNALVQSYALPAPGWCCAWDADEPQLFSVGLQSGAVLLFDVRNGALPLAELAPPEGARAPVVALQSVPRSADDAGCGLLAARLGTCSLYEPWGSRRRHDLALDGPFLHAAFEPESRRVLVSCRPCSRRPHAQHAVCRLRGVPAAAEGEQGGVMAEVVQTFRGGTSQVAMSRAALLTHPVRRGDTLLVAGQETPPVTRLWDVDSGECRHTLTTGSPALDVCGFSANDKHLLALLSEKHVRLYQWREAR